MEFFILLFQKKKESFLFFAANYNYERVLQYKFSDKYSEKDQTKKDY